MNFLSVLHAEPFNKVHLTVLGDFGTHSYSSFSLFLNTSLPLVRPNCSSPFPSPTESPPIRQSTKIFPKPPSPFLCRTAADAAPKFWPRHDEEKPSLDSSWFPPSFPSHVSFLFLLSFPSFLPHLHVLLGVLLAPPQPTPIIVASFVLLLCVQFLLFASSSSFPSLLPSHFFLLSFIPLSLPQSFLFQPSSDCSPLQGAPDLLSCIPPFICTEPMLKRCPGLVPGCFLQKGFSGPSPGCFFFSLTLLRVALLLATAVAAAADKVTEISASCLYFHPISG